MIQQLTDTFRAMCFVSIVTDTIVTTRCILTRRVFRTPAVIFLALVYICKTCRHHFCRSKLKTLEVRKYLYIPPFYFSPSLAFTHFPSTFLPTVFLPSVQA